MASREVPKNVTRVNPDSPWPGWRVRVYFAGEEYASYFSDHAHGGEEKALLLAIRWQKEVCAVLGIPWNDRRKSPVRPGGRNKRVGVGRYQGNGTWYWRAAWTELDGSRRTRNFNIEALGEMEAFRRAVETRRDAERRIFGQVLPEPFLPPAMREEVPRMMAERGTRFLGSSG